MTANLHCALPGARRGSIIDGYGSLGKTTTLLEFGRRYQRAMRKHFPAGVTPAGDEFVPVVYLSVPANTSIKGFNRHFLAVLRHHHAAEPHDGSHDPRYHPAGPAVRHDAGARRRCALPADAAGDRAGPQ